MLKNSKATSGFPFAAYRALTQRSLDLPEIAIKVPTVSSFTGAEFVVADG